MRPMDNAHTAPPPNLVLPLFFLRCSNRIPSSQSLIFRFNHICQFTIISYFIHHTTMMSYRSSKLFTTNPKFLHEWLLPQGKPFRIPFPPKLVLRAGFGVPMMIRSDPKPLLRRRVPPPNRRLARRIANVNWSTYTISGLSSLVHLSKCRFMSIQSLQMLMWLNIHLLFWIFWLIPCL